LDAVVTPRDVDEYFFAELCEFGPGHSAAQQKSGDGREQMTTCSKHVSLDHAIAPISRMCDMPNHKC
jgi:hypothetical protein